MGKKVELLAPCGSYESFLAAVHAGADAVYLGGRAFGARAYAENFSEEELISVIRQAHLFGVKVYLTVNTLVKEQEFSAIYDYLRPLYAAGLDGVIVQDMGVFAFLKQHFPELKLHASTQMTITGVYGAAYLKELGCERIVPARELSLQEIKVLKEEVSIEIEAFIHGAMCYCYSGQCLMSSVIGGRSGNRGRCAQPCRLPYKTGGKEGYFLSLKDMNTLEHIPELIEAGIDSFKIEGRMKKPEYVAGVVSVYRKYIDKYYQGKSRETSPEDKQMLSALYIRSKTGSGYYFQNRGSEMLTLQKPGYNEADETLLKKLRETYVQELPKIPLDFQVKCRAGEPFYGEVCFSEAATGESVCLSVSGPLAQKADKRAVSEEEIREQLIKLGGTPFTVKSCSVSAGENAFVPMKWVKELRRELLQKIYESCGGRSTEQTTAYSNGECVDETPACRREEEAERHPGGACVEETPICRQGQKEEKENLRLTVIVQTKAQFEAVCSVIERKDEETAEKKEAGKEKRGHLKEILIVDADLLLEEKEIRDRLFSGKLRWGIKCPVILRMSDRTYLEKLQKVIEEGAPEIVYCSTIDAFGWIKSISYRGAVAGDVSLYAWNKEAVLFWDRELKHISLPLELDSREIRELCMALRETEAKKRLPQRCGRILEKLEAPVYGRAPFMVSANCIKLSSGRCDKNRKNYTKLEDRMGNVFPVYTNCSHCYNIIYNCLPTSCYENLWMLLQDGIRSFRIEFTTEEGEAAGEVTKTFQAYFASELKEKSSGRRAAEQRREKKTGTDMPEQRKGKIAGMETTQGRFRRPVE